MQVEEVIHNSRLYSILIKERHGEKIEGEEELFFSPWSRNGFLSEIKTVQRTLSRKFTSFRRKRKREDARHEDCDPNTSAIKTNVCLSEQSKLKVIACKSGKNENSSCNNSVTGTNCTGGKSLSRIFGSFRQSFRQVKNGDELEDNCKDTTKNADQSLEEIISGRDSAYFSLTLTSTDSENEDGSHALNAYSLYSESGKPRNRNHGSIKSVTPPRATSSLGPCGQESPRESPRPVRTRNQGCQTEPKKNVTLLLPNTSTPSKPFGIHLQTQTVNLRSPSFDHHLHPDGDISWQLDTITQVAKVHLMSNFPKFNLSINIIFSPSVKCFMSLSSSTIGDLMFQLNRILFSKTLVSIVTWEVSLFMMIKFLNKLVSYLLKSGLCQNLEVSCVKFFHFCLLKEFCSYQTTEILKNVQQEFIQIWMSLLL